MKLKLYQSQTRDFQSVAVAAAAAVAVPVAITQGEFKKQLQQQQQYLQHTPVVLVKVAVGAGATLSQHGQNIALRAKPFSQLALPMRSRLDMKSARPPMMSSALRTKCAMARCATRGATRSRWHEALRICGVRSGKPFETSRWRQPHLHHGRPCHQIREDVEASWPILQRHTP